MKNDTLIVGGGDMEVSEKVKAVQKMQDYIEAHIKEVITLKKLANAAGYSPWHAERIFKELIGKTPFEYIRALRISKAALKLRDEEIKVIDVALEFVFDSHEGFTRAFSRQFGITPKYYSKNAPPIKLFTAYPIRDNYLRKMRGEMKMNTKKELSTVFVQVVDRPERKLIIKRAIKAKDYFEYAEELGCDNWTSVWGTLTSIKEALYEPIGLWLPEKLIKKGTSEYCQGVEVPKDYKGEVPEGFELIDLQACKMMVFQGPKFNDEEFEEAITDIWEIMKNYDPTLYGFKWADEEGPRFQLEPQGYRGYIEARAVKPLNE